jgi:hypothetical protein
MALCFVEGLGARSGVIVGIGLSRALQCGGGIRIGLALGVAHSLGRRSSSSICDVHGPLWAAPLPQSRVAAVVAMRRPTEADRPTDLVDEFGALKAAPIQWRGVFMLASGKAQLLFC